MTRLMTPEEYADAIAYLEEQTTPRAREEVADLIAVRVLPLGAELARVKAVQRWADTPAQQKDRRDVLAHATANHTKGVAA